MSLDIRAGARGDIASTARAWEAVVTCAIWDLFAPDDDPAVAAVATRAILAGLGGDQVPRGRLWGFRPAQGPDLLLIDERHRIRVVVEHKCGAPSQVTSLATVDSVPRFQDPVARQVPGKGTKGWHVPDGTCDCRFHTGVREGRVQAGVWQIDGYRASPWWLRKAGQLHGVTLADPQDVHWILLDRNQRAPGDAFPGATTAAGWHTTGYPAFRTTLLAAVAARRLSSPGIPYVYRVLSLIS